MPDDIHHDDWRGAWRIPVAPQRQAAAHTAKPDGLCAFPGCDSTLPRKSRMGVCTVHAHRKPYCRCIRCKPGKDG